MLKICLFFICSIIGHSSATSFTNILSVENVNGGLQVNFTLASTIPGNTNYIVIVDCMLVNATSNGTGSMQSVVCADYNFTQLQDCCDNCVTNTDGYLFAEGPVQAGEQYVCDIFGFFNGPTDNSITGNVLALTGIPSQPGFNIAVESDRTLNVSVGSEYNGGDNNIKYRIQIQDENSNVVHNRNYTTMYFEIDGLDNGEYTVTAWAINEYGTSESFQANVVVNVTIVSTSSSTTTVVSQTNDSDANIGPIVGGVVGGVVVLIAVAVAIIASVVVLLVVKKNKSGDSSKVNPVNTEN